MKQTLIVAALVASAAAFAPARCVFNNIRNIPIKNEIS